MMSVTVASSGMRRIMSMTLSLMVAGIRKGLRFTVRCKPNRNATEGVPYRLYIQVPHLQRVLFDEVAAGFDFVAHEDAEHVVGGAGVLHLNLDQRSVGGVERGFAKLLGVHFAQAFEAGHVQPLLAHLA